MAETTIWGYIAADGSINSGSGFSIEHDSTNSPGVYYIKFNESFNDVPAVTINIVKTDYSPGWWVNAIISALDATKCEIVVVGGDLNKKYNADFTFIAAGSV